MAKRLLLVVVLAISLVALPTLSGCGMAGEPSSTESLLVRYAMNEDNDNYHATARVSLVLGLVGYRVSIPIMADVDVVGTSLHGTVHADLSKLGVDDYEAEVYLHETNGHIACHVGAKVRDVVTWTDLELDAHASLDTLAASNLLASAEFNRVAVDSNEAVCYELDIPTTTLVETLLGIVDVSDLPDEFDADALLGALEGDKIRSYFTKDCLIQSATTTAMGTYAGELSKGIPVSVKVSASIVFDGYGEVDAASLVVPDEVRSASTHATLRDEDPIGVLAVVGEDNPLAKRING